MSSCRAQLNQLLHRRIFTTSIQHPIPEGSLKQSGRNQSPPLATIHSSSSVLHIFYLRLSAHHLSPGWLNKCLPTSTFANLLSLQSNIWNTIAQYFPSPSLVIFLNALGEGGHLHLSLNNKCLQRKSQTRPVSLSLLSGSPSVLSWVVGLGHDHCFFTFLWSVLRTLCWFFAWILFSFFSGLYLHPLPTCMSPHSPYMAISFS